MIYMCGLTAFIYRFPVTGILAGTQIKYMERREKADEFGSQRVKSADEFCADQIQRKSSG